MAQLQDRTVPLPRLSPLRLLALTVAAVFLSEFLVMGLLAWGGRPCRLEIALLDGILVSLLASLVLYFSLVRPLRDRGRELASLEEELEYNREAYRSLIDSTEDSIYLVDGACRYRFINRHHAQRLGHSVEAILGRAYDDLHTPEKAAEFAGIIAGVIAGGGSVRQEHWSRRDERWFLRTFTPVRERRGAAVAVTVVSKDITDLKRLEGRLQELSTTDPLTGLRNRRGFESLAEHRLKVAAREGHGATVLFADLDNLKLINDRFGHPAGDGALRDAARLLVEACRESDVVARLGGDEFAVLFTGAAATGAELIAERIRASFRRYSGAAPAEASLSVSIGITTCAPGEPCSIAELITRADQAMYVAKSAHKAAAGPADTPS